MEDSTGNQSNSISESEKSTKRLADGTNSCTITQTSSSSSSPSKTTIVYEYFESVEIKEEIIEEEKHQVGEYNHLSGRRGLDEKFISSGNTSTVKAEIVYEYDQTLEIKEEIMQDPEAVTSQKLNPKYESKSNTVDTRKANTFSANILRPHKEKKIQESITEPESKYNCQKCARKYTHLRSLISHQRFECDLPPQFPCKICEKLFKRKSTMIHHVHRVHQKTNSNQNKKNNDKLKQEAEKKQNIYRHQKANSDISQTSYNCYQCFRTYSSSRSLYDHNRLKHAAFKPKFTCDDCGYKASWKPNLSRHISSRHFKNSTTVQARYNCGKCSQSYSSLEYLKIHASLKHAAVKPQFVCDICGHKTCWKSGLSRHISSCHLKNSKTSQARYNCDRCFLNYSSLVSLKEHKLLKHAAVKPEYTCNFCEYKTDLKSSLTSHVSVRHLK